MKRLKILGLALLALFALGAVMAGAAFGEEGALVPQNVTIRGGTQILENLNKESITCTLVEGTGVPLPSGEPDHDTHSTGTLTCKGCKSSLGFACSTLGDASETILIKVLYLLCLVESVKLVWGILIAPKELPIHIEVPAVKALILIKGAVIALLLTKLKGVDLGGEPEVKEVGMIFAKEDPPTKKCSLTGLGTWTASLEAAVDTKADVDAWLEGEADITFAAAVKFMDT